MSRHDRKFMRRAIALSLKNAAGTDGGPFGAVVVKGGRVVGTGSNNVTASRDPTAHAEIVAIRAACRKLKTHDLGGAVIYTSCEPCPMCLAAILWARIDRMVYGNTRADAAAVDFDDAWFYKQVSLPVHRRALPAKRLLGLEAQRAFRVWSRNPRRVPY